MKTSFDMSDFVELFEGSLGNVEIGSIVFMNSKQYKGHAKVASVRSCNNPCKECPGYIDIRFPDGTITNTGCWSYTDGFGIKHITTIDKVNNMILGDK